MQRVGVETFKANECVAWKGATNSNSGHGLQRLANKSRPVPRLIYAIFYGLPRDAHDRMSKCPCGSLKVYQSCCRATVRHNCASFVTAEKRLPSGMCCNPLHLCIGTQSDNQRDIHRDKTGRGKVMPGETHPQSKITEQQARAAWADRQAGMTLKAAAEKHGISVSTMKDMSRGRTWNHVTGIDTAKRDVQYAKRNEAKSQAAYRKSLLQKRDAAAAGLNAEHVGFQPVEWRPPKIRRTDNTWSEAEQPTTSKKCSKCAETKPVEAFPWKNKARGIRKAFCSECQRSENAKYRKPRGVRAERFADERVLRPGESTEHCSRCGEDVPEHGMSSNGSWCKACRREWERESKLPKPAPVLNPTTQQCCDCGETKSVDLFPWKKLNVKRKNHCKECDKVRCRKYRAAKDGLGQEVKGVERVKAVEKAVESSAPKFPSVMKCVDCHATKPTADFGWVYKNVKHKKFCRECDRERSRRHYATVRSKDPVVHSGVMLMCSDCGTTKPEEDFRFIKRDNKRMAHCRACEGVRYQARRNQTLGSA